MALVAILIAIAWFAVDAHTPANAQTQAECNGSGPYTVPSDWALKPSAIGPGGTFRLLFISSGARNATSTAIADYNTFVQTAAKAGHSAITDSCGNLFTAVASTATVDARDNTATTGAGVPIYWLNGAKLADNYADFYDGSWDEESGSNCNDENGSGSSCNRRAWTGSNNNGTKHATGHLGTTQNNARTGGLGLISGGPISGEFRPKTAINPLYGLSPEFQVAKPRVFILNISSTSVSLRFQYSKYFTFNEAGVGSTSYSLIGQGDPAIVTLIRLKPDTEYELHHAGETHRFRTLPPAASPFRNLAVTFPNSDGQGTARIEWDGLYLYPNSYKVGVCWGADCKITNSGNLSFPPKSGRSRIKSFRPCFDCYVQGSDSDGDGIGRHRKDVTGIPQSTTIRVQVLWIRYGTEGTLVETGTSTPNTQFSPPDEEPKREVIIEHKPALTPKVSIAAGADVTEGGSAVFTLVANPAPSADLSISVNVTQSGDFGASTGSQTVTVGTSGTATLTVATSDDATDEPDGSVTATLSAGSGYTVGSAGSASVAVSDDDDPPVQQPDTTELEANAAQVVQDAIDHHRNTTGNVTAAERFERFLALLQDADGAATQEYTDFCSRAQNNGWTTGVKVCDAMDPVFTARQAAQQAVSQQQEQQADDPPPAYTPPASLVADVRGYVAEKSWGSDHVKRWKRVLIGLGVESYNGLTALTAAEAQVFADYGWARWIPVASELAKAEAAQ